jgi:hypothetical protein
MMLGFTPLVAAWYVYSLYALIHLHKPVLIATTTWLFVTFCYVVWRLLRNGPRRIVSAEPCAQFLEREFEGKLQFALETRRWILLLVPAVLAAWWGGGPTLGAKRLGIESPWLLAAAWTCAFACDNVGACV